MHLRSERKLLEASEKGAEASVIAELQQKSEYALQLWDQREHTGQLRTAWTKMLRFLEYLDTHSEWSHDVLRPLEVSQAIDTIERLVQSECSCMTMRLIDGKYRSSRAKPID